jgi:hypothetical protein
MKEGRDLKYQADTNAIMERMQLNSIMAIIKIDFLIP